MKKHYWYVFITYIIVQFSGILFIPLIYSLLPLTDIQAIAYWNIFSFTTGLIIIFYLMRPDIKLERTRQTLSTIWIIIWSVVGIFMAYFAQIIAATIEVYVLNITPGSENTATIMDFTRAVPFFAIIPVIIAPILEELIFRKIIFGSLYKRTNFFIAATISALIFGFIHGEPVHILIYASMGYVFAFLYVKTKRIIVPIVAHMGMNLIAVLYQYSVDPEELEQMLKELEQLKMIFIGG